MIILILSTILGICGIIPPEHFDSWRSAMVIELIFDFPATFLYLWLSNKWYDYKEATRENKRFRRNK